MRNASNQPTKVSSSLNSNLLSISNSTDTAIVIVHTSHILDDPIACVCCNHFILFCFYPMNIFFFLLFSTRHTFINYTGCEIFEFYFKFFFILFLIFLIWKFRLTSIQQPRTGLLVILIIAQMIVNGIALQQVKEAAGNWQLEESRQQEVKEGAVLFRAELEQFDSKPVTVSTWGTKADALETDASTAMENTNQESSSLDRNTNAESITNSGFDSAVSSSIPSLGSSVPPDSIGMIKLCGEGFSIHLVRLVLADLLITSAAALSFVVRIVEANQANWSESWRRARHWSEKRIVKIQNTIKLAALKLVRSDGLALSHRV